MKTKLILSILIFCCLFFHIICFAAVKGTTGAQFLKIGIGARPIGMGESFVAVADDANSTYWNPAGLGEIQTVQIATTYLNWFENINYTYLSYIQPIKDTSLYYGTIGISAAYLSAGNIDKTDIDSSDNIIDTGESFTASDLAFILSYGSKINKFLLGSNLKFIKQTIEQEQAYTYTFDLGLVYLFSDKLRLGFAAQNIINKIKFVLEDNPLPLNISAGMALKLNSNAIISFDTNLSSESTQPDFHFGIELPLNSVFTMRTGYKTNTTADLDTLSGISLGLGLKLKQYYLDYAWVPYGDLGKTHHLSLLIKF